MNYLLVITMSCKKIEVGGEEECCWLLRIQFYSKNNLPPDLEVLSAVVTINNLNSVICFTYRPPNYTDQYDTLLLSYLRSFDDSTDLLIVGDLNPPDVDWNTYSGCSTISNAYAEMIFDLT